MFCLFIERGEKRNIWHVLRVLVPVADEWPFLPTVREMMQRWTEPICSLIPVICSRLAELLTSVSYTLFSVCLQKNSR